MDPLSLDPILSRMADYGVFSFEGLLLDWGLDKYMKVLEMERKNDKFACCLRAEIPDDLEEEDKEKLKGIVRDALLRCGWYKHGNLNRVMEKLRAYDDIIAALDTNVILDCIITSIMLDEIYAFKLPNWLLFTVPKLVMAEIERKASQKFSGKHPRRGWPTYAGRIGRRGLQEILQLDTNIDYRGLSIMTIGRIPEIYDQLVKDERRMDSEIRTQFRDFLKNIDFHKGTFFLTQDRTNAMMARAEGLEGLYLQKPEWSDIVGKKMIQERLSQMLYELTVTFGEVRVSSAGGHFDLSIFWSGKHVLDWEKSRVKIIDLKGIDGGGLAK